MKQRFCLVLAVLMFFGMLSIMSGCETSAENKEMILTGWVMANDPISQAKLTIYDTKGNIVHETEAESTGSMGSFMIEVENLPVDFRIVAEDGISNDELFPVKMISDYRNFDPNKDRVHINILTTMAAMYFDANPNKTLDEAAQIVREFLVLPDWIDIERSFERSNKYFDYNEFFNQAVSVGGINEYIGYFVNNPTLSHSFAVEESSGLPQSATSTIATTLAKSAATYAGQELAGWALKEMGFGFKDATQEQLDGLKIQMVEISEQLTRIENEIKELKNMVVQAEYNERISGLITLIGSITDIQKDLENLVTNPSTNKETMESRRNLIVENIKDNILKHKSDIHLELVGVANSTPLLKLYNTIVKNRNRFLSYEDSKIVNDHYEYFRQLQEFQLLLEVEYWHFMGEGGDDTAEIDSALQRYNDNIEQQSGENGLIKDSIPEGLILDVSKNIMYAVPRKLYPKRRDVYLVANDYNDGNHLGYNGWKHMETYNTNVNGRDAPSIALALLNGHGGSSESFAQHLLDQGWGENNIIEEMDRFGVKKINVVYDYFSNKVIYRKEVYLRYNYSENEWYKHDDPNIVKMMPYSKTLVPLLDSDWFTFFFYRNMKQGEVDRFFW